VNSEKNLVEVAAFFSLLRLFIKPKHFIDYLHIRQEHSPAAIALNPQTIQNIASVLARADSSREFFPLVTDEFAARETSNGNNQLAFAYL
jgi:hypothetical protein